MRDTGRRARRQSPWLIALTARPYVQQIAACMAIAYCHNDACRHQAVINVSSYPADTPVPWFRSRANA